MHNYAEALYKIKRGFLIIGLTGYTGSGCSTAAGLLATKKKPKLPGYTILDKISDERRYKKLNHAWNELEWNRFVNIEASKVIFLFAIYRSITSSFKHGPLSTLKTISTPHRKQFQNIKYLFQNDVKLSNKNKAQKIIEAYNLAKPLYVKFKTSCKFNLEEFIQTMQDFGDQIRQYGIIKPNIKSSPSPDHILILPEAIRRLIKSYRIAEKKSLFVIDAFRNPFEVEFFKRRYNEFYLVSIHRKEKERKEVLQGLSKEFLEKLENREKGNLVEKKSKDNAHEWLTSQNLDDCQQKADIFILNQNDTSKTWPFLRFHLIKLITLSQKPGVITPKKDERCMQLAISARQNSGCISRHVGAVVANEDGFVLGVGWNDPPSGQIPCSLRSGNELTSELPEEIYSAYERSSEFVTHIKSTNIGDNPFCFREELFNLSGKKQAEFTRSLHAEENALLQATRHGIKTLSGGTLYTTDSTCTLCAKKAYHLGIKRIVYIEEYPGIAFSQTIQSGRHKIETDRFQGVTGESYFRLFCPLVPEKDLIKLYM